MRQAVQGALVRRLAEEGEVGTAVLQSRALLSCPPGLVMQALQAVLARVVASNGKEPGCLDFACQVSSLATLCLTWNVLMQPAIERFRATCSGVSIVSLIVALFVLMK